MRTFSLFAQMAESAEGRGDTLPKSIRQLCLAYNRDADHIDLFCQFCHKPLSILDKICFDHAKLTLLWRDGSPRGVCVLCARILARVEFTQRHEVSCSAQQAAQYIGSSLEEAVVRCLRCLTPLQRQEKALLVRDNRTVHKVWGTWRAPCVRCMIGLF